MHLDLVPNDAINLLKEIKQKGYSTSYLVIYTEKQDDFIQELAFNSGADCFINFHQKPSIMKFFLRNLLRRRIVRELTTSKDIVMNADRFLIYKSGKPVQLPRKEFRIFELLYNSSGKFISKQEIAAIVWKDEAVAKKRTIDVHIYNIR